MKKLQSNYNFYKLLIANTISRVGDSIDMLAFSWLIYEITGKASWSAIIVGINQGCSVILQPLIGSYVERLNKRKTMIITDYARFFSIVLLYIIYKMELCNKTVLVTFTAAISFIETFRIPAGVAIIPQILDREKYDKGISMNNGLSRFSEFIGMFIAGVLIKFIGSISAILIDGFTFLASAMIIQTIKIADTEIEVKNRKNVITEMFDGFRLLIRNKELLLICLICALINAVVIPYDVLLPALIKGYFDAEPLFLTIFNIVFSLGMIIGAFAYGLIKIKEQRKSSLFIVGGFIIGVFYIAISFIINFDMYVLIKGFHMCSQLLLVGIAIAIMNSYVQVYFVKNVKQEYLARISSISTSITMVGAPIASFILAYASRQFGIIALLFGTGVISLMLFGVTSIIFYNLRGSDD